MNDITVGIISFEHMHAFSYAHAFRDMPGTRLVAAADSDANRVARLSKELAHIPKFYADYRELLEQENPDAVIVTTANADHCSVALECIRRKKHVLCEKPIATTVGDAKRMIEAARASGVTLMTAFPVRFSPAVAKARDLVRGGALGRVVGGCTSNHGSMPGGWFIDVKRSGGGAVMDHTVHVADLLRWILDDEVIEVYAEYANRLHDIPCEDCGQLMLRFRSGSVFSLDTSWSRPKSYSTWGDVKIEIKGETANASLNCFPRAINRFDDQTMRHTTSSPVADLDGLMVREFLAAIREQRPPLVTGEDGLRALEIALAAYKAGEAGAPAKVALEAV